MDSGIVTWKDFFELISYAVTAIGIIALAIGFYSYNLNKKQLSFSVLDRCISIFQDKFSSISNKSKKTEVKAYVDFVNEELFYFAQEYIPKDVAHEWIDGMIEYMPIYGKNFELLNPDNSLRTIHESNLLNDFHRIKKAFTVKEEYDIKLIYSEYKNEDVFLKRGKERKRLVKEIYGNIR